ncbi:putative ankyrin repeat-containing domain superfamily [Helianthus anomalus]
MFLYIPLYRAIELGDWERAQEIFNQDKRTLIVEIAEDEKTALHVAISNPENISFLENLLSQIYVDEESLLPLATALRFAIQCGNKLAVELLVNKNPHLLFINYFDDDDYGRMDLPLERAALYSQRAILDYLFEKYKQHIGLIDNFGYTNPFKGDHLYDLFSHTIVAEYFGKLNLAFTLQPRLLVLLHAIVYLMLLICYITKPTINLFCFF